MKPTVREYYAQLRQDYPTKIRQLVPRYDEMIECIVDLLRLFGPRTVLDIGAGIGNVTTLVLERIPEARVTALEANEAMCAATREAMRSAKDRVEVVRRDIRDFDPGRRFDAVISNLVLHNLDRREKKRLLVNVRTWLEPHSAFIWGDLIRYADARIQAHFVDYRKAFARVAGCADDLLGRNFEKEEHDDHPLTVEETLIELAEAGFSSAAPVWSHDTFAVFVAR